VRLSAHAIKGISTATDVNFKQFFSPEALRSPKDKHFSDSEIAYYYGKLQSEASKRGIRFSTCYIGNGEKDYRQYQDLWSNKTDCCDAKGNVSGIKTTSQSIPWEERVKHAPFSTREGLLSAAKQEPVFPGLRLIKSEILNSHIAVDS
jgi:hypothetical protein